MLDALTMADEALAPVRWDRPFDRVCLIIGAVWILTLIWWHIFNHVGFERAVTWAVGIYAAAVRVLRRVSGTREPPRP